ncbi:MAG: glycosyltransferase, partial [Kiritimatiellae bacterium]|nr:glycosyltransferase [Kiritimatiellia bacterium]
MPDKRRLLVVSHGFPPYYGGAEHAAGHLAAAAASSRRWSVDVLTSDIGGRLPSCETWRGVNVVRVPARKRHWTNHNVVELLSFLRSASRNIELKRPDWILAHFTLPGGEVARRWAGRFGVPYAVVLHGADVPDSQKRRFGAVYPLIKPLVRRVWRQAARVIAVSDGLRELALRTWPEGRIEVVPNGVDIERFRPAEMPTVRDGGTLVVVAVARLVEIKGLQHLIAALARIPADMRSQIRLRLCGTGPYEGELRRQVREAGLDEQVEFAGLIAYDEIPRQLRQSDVFVLPSLQEGLPLSLLEAMASGLPVVATAVGGIPGVVKDGVNGLLVPAAAPA